MNEVLQRARLQQHKRQKKQSKPDASCQRVGHHHRLVLHVQYQLAEEQGRRDLGQLRHQAEDAGDNKLAVVVGVWTAIGACFQYS